MYGAVSQMYIFNLFQFQQVVTIIDDDGGDVSRISCLYTSVFFTDRNATHPLQSKKTINFYQKRGIRLIGK